MAFEGKAVKVLLDERFNKYFDERIPLFIKFKYIITEEQYCDRKVHAKLGSFLHDIAGK